jgi:hypothetical protein
MAELISGGICVARWSDICSFSTVRKPGYYKRVALVSSNWVETRRGRGRLSRCRGSAYLDESPIWEIATALNILATCIPLNPLIYHPQQPTLEDRIPS